MSHIPVMAKKTAIIRPTMPDMRPVAKFDVMAGPRPLFRPLAPSQNTPKALLLRPGNLGLGTRMG